MTLVADRHTLAELDAYAKRHGQSVRLSISPGGPVANRDRPTCLAYLALYDKPGKDAEEIDGVFIPKKANPYVLDEAASLLLEIVQRTPTPED